jgi:hypothetical protein
MSKEFTNKDHEWAQQKLKRITNDPHLLIAVLEEQLRQYHARKEWEREQLNKKRPTP